MPVYIIQADGTDMVKIGWSKNAKSRIKRLQTAHFAKLVLLRIIEGDRPIESALHHRFRHLRRAGEWFTFDPQMMTEEIDGVQVPPRRNQSSGAIRPSPPYGPPLKRAIAAAGGVTSLAAHLKIVPSNIPQWRRVPPHHCLAVAALTGIPATELRPDIFVAPPAPAAQPAEAHVPEGV